MNMIQRGFLALCLIASTMAGPVHPSAASQIVSQGANLFSSNFVKTVAREEGNLICSPLSANIALNMAAVGSEGETKKQFKDVLKLPETQTQTLEGYQQLINELNNVGGNITLKLANKMFIANHFLVKPEYKNTLQTYFYSDIQSVNFAQKQQAADIINDWCKEKTNNRIDKVIKPENLDISTALVLANAVYFKGKWAKEFDPKNTMDRPFHINSNTVKNVSTMYNKGYYKFTELSEYNVKCIELPYANAQISMVIILPNEIDGLAALTNQLDVISEACNTRLSQIHEREVKLYLPKFKIESELNLNDALANKMGLSIPFSPGADFHGISDVPLLISDVVQKAFIEVNEEGSEAAAVTGGIVIPLSLGWQPPEPINVHVDHPFLMIIKYYNYAEDKSRPLSRLMLPSLSSSNDLYGYITLFIMKIEM